MRDYAFELLFLPLRAVDGLVFDAYQVCLDAVRAHESDLASDQADALRDEVPDPIEVTKLAQAILNVAMTDLYAALPLSVFDPGMPTGRTFTRHPELWQKVEKGGLLNMSGIDTDGQAVFSGSDAVRFHPLLRRSFGGHINDDLIKIFLSAAGKTNHLGVAIDDGHFVPRSGYSQYFEHDYWRGPPLSNSNLDDPRKFGTTVHLTPDGRRTIPPYTCAGASTMRVRSRSKSRNWRI